MELYLILFEIVVFVLITTLMYLSMQRLDFSKLFKANSTTQIKAIIVCVSSAIGFMISLGLGNILELILELK